MHVPLCLAGIVLLTACSGRGPAVAVQPQPLPDAAVDSVKLAVLPSIYAALNELPNRFRAHLLIDSLIGPSPTDIAAPRSHSRAWLDSAIVYLRATGLTALTPRRWDVPPVPYVLSVGQPYLISPGRAGIRFIVRAPALHTDLLTACGPTVEVQLQRGRTGYREATRQRVYVGCSSM